MEKHKKTPKTNSEELDTVGLSLTTLLISTAILAAVYYVFSTLSNGFYQHDEVGNFMGAQQIWHDNLLGIVGANTKSGYRLLYAIPALGGFAFLKLFNSIIAALTVFFSYKILQKYKSKNGLLIFFILGLQPLWFMLSFRNYAELTIAFLLVLSLLQFINKKYIIAALLMSYVAFTRQEYHVLSGLFFIVLLFRKKWLAALLTGTFTFLQVLLAFIKTGDILYLPKAIMAYSERIKEAWPKQGFDHYFLMSDIIFGAVAITLFVSYCAIMILKKKKPNWFLLLPVIAVFLLNCAFNAKFFAFGPGNGGNLRYLITISPLIAILGVLAVDEITDFKKKHLLLIFLIPLIILVGVYQTFGNNFVHLNEVRNWMPLWLTIATVFILILPLKTKQYVLSLAVISLLVGATSITSRKIQPEEVTVKKAAKWYAHQLKLVNTPKELFNQNSRIACGHALFYYYLDKNKYDFKKMPIMAITKETTDTLKVGDLLIWDSHYGYRPKLRPTSQKYEYYQNNPKFQRIQYYQSKDNRFTIVFFRKVAD